MWNLGIIDSPVRNGVKIGMALVWTLGPGLIFVPRGVKALRKLDHGTALGLLMLLSVVPALASHLLVQFGVQGWCLHYVPALLGLLALGALGISGQQSSVTAVADRSKPIQGVALGWSIAAPSGPDPRRDPPGPVLQSAKAVTRLAVVASVLAAMFWFYPTNYQTPGFRGNFDLAFCRFTRAGLRTPMPAQGLRYWRTANSRTWVERTGRG